MEQLPTLRVLDRPQNGGGNGRIYYLREFRDSGTHNRTIYINRAAVPLRSLSGYLAGGEVGESAALLLAVENYTLIAAPLLDYLVKTARDCTTPTPYFERVHRGNRPSLLHQPHAVLALDYRQSGTRSTTRIDTSRCHRCAYIITHALQCRHYRCRITHSRAPPPLVMLHSRQTP